MTSWARAADRISVRIAMTVILALIVAQGIGFLVFLMRGPPDFKLFTLDWIAEQVGLAIDDRTDFDPRMEAVRTAPPERLSLDDSGWPFNAVRAALVERLGARARAVRISLPPQLGGLPSSAPVIVGELDVARVPTESILLPGFIEIWVERTDGQWFRVRPVRPKGPGPSATEAAVLLGLAAFGVGIPSVLTARRLVQPLERLAAAATRLGVAHATTPVPETGPVELRAIARAFNLMQQRLKRFVDDRVQLVAALSHDLRTPLTRLRLRTEFIADDEQRLRFDRDLAEMEAMVATTLDFLSGDARAEKRQPVDLAALLITLCDDATDAGFAIEFRGPGHLVIDCQPTATRRALANLIENAGRHAGGGIVTLTGDAAEVTVEIADSGPGIPAERLEEMFQPFRRVDDSRNRETGGTGLGLTIARAALRGQGGDVTLRPARPTGLIATALLPRLDSQTRQGDPAG